LWQSGEPVRVGVVGAGGMGTRHARNLRGRAAGVRIVAVADADVARAQALAEECGAARVYRDGRELVADPDVEAVVVASPDPTHADYVLACLDARKPVFCEKPLATRPSEARAIVEREVALGRRLVQVGFQRRYDAEFRAVRRAIVEGAVGRPVLYRAWHRNVRAAYAPDSNAAVLVNAAIHDLDEVRWLSGQEVEVVHAVTGCTVDRSLAQGVFDLQLIQLGLADGALALVELNLSAAYGYEVGVEVCGDRGTVTAGLPGGVVVRSEGRCGRAVAQDWLERFDDAYAAELAAWVDRVRRGDPWPDAWDGYASLVLAEACEEALARGGPVRVDLEPRPALYAREGG
jgi:myo-inositol 2-dehydrogenase/D-chiro-inositol 1-dehydrogenase